jgi:hypothetical protein
VLNFRRRPNSRYWSQNDEVPRIEAYGRVFKTWSDWLNNNIDPARTSVFFMTISPLHIRWTQAASSPSPPFFFCFPWYHCGQWLVLLGVICNATLNFVDHCRLNRTPYISLIDVVC